MIPEVMWHVPSDPLTAKELEVNWGMTKKEIAKLLDWLWSHPGWIWENIHNPEYDYEYEPRFLDGIPIGHIRTPNVYLGGVLLVKGPTGVNVKMLFSFYQVMRHWTEYEKLVRQERRQYLKAQRELDAHRAAQRAVA